MSGDASKRRLNATRGFILCPQPLCFVLPVLPKATTSEAGYNHPDSWQFWSCKMRWVACGLREDFGYCVALTRQLIKSCLG